MATEDRTGMGDQGEHAPLLVLQAPGLGREALQALVLLGDPLSAPAGDRRGQVLLERHEAGLLSYFAHRVTNAGAEGINSRIQAIRVAGRGYRNRKNFKTAIWFHLGDLQLYRIAP